MKTGLGILLMAILFPLSMLAENWIPEPMVIDVQDVVEYAFDGSTIDIPFALSGKSGKLWLVIETRLPDIEKPVAVMNGFKGWHFVNGIDTTVYVSTAREFLVSDTNVFPWDGFGNEKGAANAFDQMSGSGQVLPGDYTFYLWGYDHQSDRDLACDFLPIGNFWEGQYLRFYPYDETGALYDRPILMGQLPFFNASTITKSFDELIGRADLFKWKMGNDPLETSLLETSHVTGYNPNEVYEHPEYDPIDNPMKSYMVGYGAGIFDPRDHNVFYFAKNRWWLHDQTVVKYQFVPEGDAIQDTLWGDYDRVSWSHPGNRADYSQRSVLHNLGKDTLVMLDGGQNPIDFQHDRLHAFNIDNPAQESFDIQLNEFHMPEQPVDPSSQALRTSSEINRLFPGKRDGTFFVTGDWSCLQELIDVSRLIEADGALAPYNPDGSGYVVWANSNGDFFFDMSPYPDPENLAQTWACIVSDPRNSNNPREELQPADMNGFLISYNEFIPNIEFGVYCPDGSGIAYAGFGDSMDTSWYSAWKNGGGEIMDYGGQYDGMYILPSPRTDLYYSYFSAEHLKTCWIAFDSDAGIITNDPNSISAVDESPGAFSVSQNSPNPFNPSTTIAFTLPEAGQVSVDIYNIAGQKVYTLLDDFMTAGSHSVVWDASGFATGMYFFTVASGGYSETIKMTLVK